MSNNFDNDENIAHMDDREVKNTRGLKIGNKKSKFQEEMAAKAKASKESQAFGEKADEFMEKRQEKTNRGIEVSSRLIKALRDTTLPQNKGTIAKEFEAELRGDLFKFIVDLNNDPDEQDDGMGSATALALVIKVLFEMRDALNESNYKFETLQKDFNLLTHSLNIDIESLKKKK